jgi:ABC-type multidrug transport system fused ATPase/permease subunit
MRFWRHIRELAQQRTILAITHRLSTVMDMDRIVVLEDGAVIESGTPETLWQQNTRFRQLYEMQMGVSGKTSESTV